MGQSVFPVPSSGGPTIYPLSGVADIPPNVTLKQTFTSSNGSITYPAGTSTVYAILIGAGSNGVSTNGGAGAAGAIVSGWTLPYTSITVGTSGGRTTFGSMVAQGGSTASSPGGSASSTPYLNTIGNYHSAGIFLGSGGGGGQAGQAATLRGYTGGVSGSPGNSKGGGGGGAGYNGNGTNGGPDGSGSTNYGGVGGDGGSGGGGGGAGGAASSNGGGAGGLGGAGVAYIYY
jgi:hypothetical protein